MYMNVYEIIAFIFLNNKSKCSYNLFFYFITFMFILKQVELIFPHAKHDNSKI